MLKIRETSKDSFYGSFIRFLHNYISTKIPYSKFGSIEHAKLLKDVCKVFEGRISDYDEKIKLELTKQYGIEKKELRRIQSEDCENKVSVAESLSVESRGDPKLTESLLIKDSPLDSGASLAVECALHDIFVGHDEPFGIGHRLRSFLVNLKRIDSGSYGIVSAGMLRTYISQSDKIFAVKVPTRSEKEYFTEIHALHEGFVGLVAINKIRAVVPNFVYTFGCVACPTPVVEYREGNGKNKTPRPTNVLSWCSSDMSSNRNSKELTHLLFIENLAITGKPWTFADIITKECSGSNWRLGISNIFSYLAQIIGACGVAWKMYGFVHHDLHTGNVIMRTPPSAVGKGKDTFWVRYPLLSSDSEDATSAASSLYIRSEKFIPTIIDFGMTRVVVNKLAYGSPLHPGSGHAIQHASARFDVSKLVVSTLREIGSTLYTNPETKNQAEEIVNQLSLILLPPIFNRNGENTNASSIRREDAARFLELIYTDDNYNMPIAPPDLVNFNHEQYITETLSTAYKSVIGVGASSQYPLAVTSLRRIRDGEPILSPTKDFKDSYQEIESALKGSPLLERSVLQPIDDSLMFSEAITLAIHNGGGELPSIFETTRERDMLVNIKKNITRFEKYLQHVESSREFQMFIRGSPSSHGKEVLVSVVKYLEEANRFLLLIYSTRFVYDVMFFRLNKKTYEEINDDVQQLYTIVDNAVADIFNAAQYGIKAIRGNHRNPMLATYQQIISMCKQWIETNGDYTKATKKIVATARSAYRAHMHARSLIHM